MTTDCSWNYHENYKHRTWAEHALSFHGNSMNNLLSYCGLVDATISASEKDSPVQKIMYPLIYLNKLKQLQKSYALKIWGVLLGNGFNIYLGLD